MFKKSPVHALLDATALKFLVPVLRFREIDDSLMLVVARETYADPEDESQLVTSWSIHVLPRRQAFRLYGKPLPPAQRMRFWASLPPDEILVLVKSGEDIAMGTLPTGTAAASNASLERTNEFSRSDLASLAEPEPSARDLGPQANAEHFDDLAPGDVSCLGSVEVAS